MHANMHLMDQHACLHAENRFHTTYLTVNCAAVRHRIVDASSVNRFDGEVSHLSGAMDQPEERPLCICW